MDIKIIEIGGRKFIQFSDCGALPIDRIKSIDLNAPNGGCDNSVRFITDDPADDWIFAYKNADTIREFLKQHEVPVDPRILSEYKYSSQEG